MKNWTKRLLGLTLSAALLLTPAFAAEEAAAPAAQEISPWAYLEVADSYALGLVDNDFGTYILSPVNEVQLLQMTDIVANKLALLGVPARPAVEGETPLVIDTTRGGVMNALFQEVAAYQFPGLEAGAAAYLTSLGVVKGELALERTCTYQEAMALASRLILALYDQQDAGSKGLLWKATNGENTLYLLGTIHVDRDNVYPMHKSLRDALMSSQKAIFEVDFNDTEGTAAFVALQNYSDGTTLKDHISPALYTRVAKTATELGMTPAQVDSTKAWALASTFNVLGMQDGSTSSNAMPMDAYITAKASNAGLEIGAIETLAFQGAIFDDLSREYQEAYLDATLSLYEAAQTDSTSTEEAKQVSEATQQLLTQMFEGWKTRNPELLEKAYDKTAILASDDELNSKLFTDRDPNMIKAAAEYLETEGKNTFFMAAGAGHMVDPGGIVSGLQKLGYTVELVK